MFPGEGYHSVWGDFFFSRLQTEFWKTHHGCEKNPENEKNKYRYDI